TVQELADRQTAPIFGCNDDLAGSKSIPQLRECVGLGCRPIARFTANKRPFAGNPDKRQRNEMLVFSRFDQLCDTSGLRPGAEDEDPPLQQSAPQRYRESSASDRDTDEPDQ